MLASPRAAGPFVAISLRLACHLALLCLTAMLPPPAFAGACPAGQRQMVFPAESRFEYWRYSTVSSNFARELIWSSESRQQRLERLPLFGGNLDEYFDFGAQTLTLVQYNGGTVAQCNQFAIADSFSRPSVGSACFAFAGTANDGGLLPVERWVVQNGSGVDQDVIAERLGEELLPLRLFDRTSSTIHVAYMNFSSEVEDADFVLPCTPTVQSGSADEALRELEDQLDLPTGTLGNSNLE
ncbi:MAG: hypothetical protein KDI56_14995, partial [Xanthomonadales bacterium]|nr:hypothetical protein [Xanthomonadales bacterium]